MKVVRGEVGERRMKARGGGGWVEEWVVGTGRAGTRRAATGNLSVHIGSKTGHNSAQGVPKVPNLIRIILPYPQRFFHARRDPILIKYRSF